MSYRHDTPPEERREDCWTLRLLALFAASDVRQSLADRNLIWSKVVQGEDGTLRVVC